MNSRYQRGLSETTYRKLTDLQQELERLDARLDNDTFLYITGEHVEQLPPDKRPFFIYYLANLPDEIKELRRDADGTDVLALEWGKLTQQQRDTLEAWGRRMDEGVKSR